MFASNNKELLDYLPRMSISKEIYHSRRMNDNHFQTFHVAPQSGRKLGRWKDTISLW